jgi:hypothetical protein
VLVRSGISGAIDLSALPANRRPDAAVESVAELVAAFGGNAIAPAG